MLFDFLSMGIDYEDRKVARDEIGDATIDTAAVTDSDKPYETGIKHPAYNDGAWVIVELYVNKEAAKIGHNKWIGVMKQKPKELFDRNESEVGDLAESFDCDIRKGYSRDLDWKEE